MPRTNQPLTRSPWSDRQKTLPKPPNPQTLITHAMVWRCFRSWRKLRENMQANDLKDDVSFVLYGVLLQFERNEWLENSCKP